MRGWMSIACLCFGRRDHNMIACICYRIFFGLHALVQRGSFASLLTWLQARPRSSAPPRHSPSTWRSRVRPCCPAIGSSRAHAHDLCWPADAPACRLGAARVGRWLYSLAACCLGAGWEPAGRLLWWLYACALVCHQQRQVAQSHLPALRLPWTAPPMQPPLASRSSPLPAS